MLLDYAMPMRQRAMRFLTRFDAMMRATLLPPCLAMHAACR